MHDQGVGFGKGELFLIQAEIAEIFLGRGDERAMHPLTLQAQHHDDIGPFQAPAHIVEDLEAEAFDPCRHQGCGADEAHPCAQCRQAQHVGPRHPRMQDIAADRHHKPLDAALGSADGQRVEQRLGWMFMRPVAGIDHRAIDLFRQELHGACRVVAHHDDVGAHGVQGHGRIDEGFTLLGRRIGNRHVHHVSAQALAREFKRGLRARRRLEKEIDLRAAAQTGFFFLDLA